MKEAYKKRNELRNASIFLRSAKFGKNIKGNGVTRLIDEQNEVYKKFKFFDNLIKSSNK